tara:strand:- start:3 stop:230 length:228 start_codon:yes stop_codon:yes gene_type:complete
MGRMKELYMQVIQENIELPEDITIADLFNMHQLETYNWEEYEKQRKKQEIHKLELNNTTEIEKVKKIQQKFKTNK